MKVSDEEAALALIADPTVDFNFTTGNTIGFTAYERNTFTI